MTDGKPVYLHSKLRTRECLVCKNYLNYETRNYLPISIITIILFIYMAKKTNRNFITICLVTLHFSLRKKNTFDVNSHRINIHEWMCHRCETDSRVEMSFLKGSVSDRVARGVRQRCVDSTTPTSASASASTLGSARHLGDAGSDGGED